MNYTVIIRLIWLFVLRKRQTVHNKVGNGYTTSSGPRLQDSYCVLYYFKGAMRLPISPS